MDLDENDFTFCPTDFHDHILNNELLLPDSENTGDFDILSHLLSSSHANPFHTDDSYLPGLTFEGNKPADKPIKEASSEGSNENHLPVRNLDKPMNLDNSLSKQTTAKPIKQSDTSLVPSTVNMPAGSSLKICPGEQPREISSRLPMESAPSSHIRRQDNQLAAGSLQAERVEGVGHQLRFKCGDRQQFEGIKTLQPTETFRQAQNMPKTTYTGGGSSFAHGNRESLMCLQLSEIPSLPKNDSGHHQGVDMDSVLTQIDLTRIPSGNSGGSMALETPKCHALIEDASQPKLRYSEGASASHYCHICGRASNTAQLAACANVRIGLCRKTLCEKCLLLHQRDLFHWAKAKNTTWTCTHCRGVCPKRARCHQYQRNNMRRRLKKGTSDEVQEAFKVDKKPIAKTPTSKKANGKTQLLPKTPRFSEVAPSIINSIPLQFTPVAMSISGGSSSAQRPDEASPNRVINRKESSRSQNALSTSLNVVSGPTAHVNVASGAFVEFDVSSARAATREGPGEVKSLAIEVARPGVKQIITRKSDEDGVSPTGVAEGMFAEGFGMIKVEGQPAAGAESQ